MRGIDILCRFLRPQVEKKHYDSLCKQGSVKSIEAISKQFDEQRAELLDCFGIEKSELDAIMGKGVPEV